MTHVTRVSLVVLAAACAIAEVGGAPRQEPSFRVASELVVIDLVAVDREGRFIADLRPDEIEVKEDGKRQAVQLLRLVGSPAPASAVPSAGARADQATARAADTSTAPAGTADTPPRRLAIVVDTLSLSIDAVPRVRQALLDALDDLPDGLPVLVATIGPALQVVHPFTTDKAVLRRAVSALSVQLDPPAGVQRVFDAIDRLCASAVDQQRVVETAVEAAEQLIVDAQARGSATSESLAVLADRLGALQGRKHLVFYSSGHAMSPVAQAIDAVSAAVTACTGLDPMVVRREASSALGRLTGRAASEGLRTAIERANRAQVAFYTLDPSGVATSAIMPSTRGTAQTGGAGPMIAFAGLRADAGRDYVEGLAAETGGLTIKSNDMAAVLRRAWEDAGQYYLVGYPPPAARGRGEVRKISVSVKRRGASVRYRKGYITEPPVAAPRAVTRAEGTLDASPALPVRPAREDTVTPPRSADPGDAVAGQATDLLARAAAYVDAFVGRFSNVVLEESLTQTHTTAPSTLGGRYSRVLTPGTTTKRQLRSEFLLVRPPSTVFWLSFRDVVEVDGRVVGDRQHRLEQLFLRSPRSGLAEAQRIATEGTRHFLGTRTRTTTSPVFALAFLQPHYHSRFRYRLEPPRGTAETPFRVLTAEEVHVPTLLRTETGDNLPLRGRYDVDPATGTVLASEVAVRTMGESVVLRTRFAFDERTQTYVPTEMTEEHLMRSGERVFTVARYGRVRAFSVTTTEAVP